MSKKIKAKRLGSGYSWSDPGEKKIVLEWEEGKEPEWKFSKEDYSFHISDTSGRVLPCSESWYKDGDEVDKD